MSSLMKDWMLIVCLLQLYLYGTNSTSGGTLSYNEFVNKELILFSSMDNERSIPSVVDGMLL